MVSEQARSRRGQPQAGQRVSVRLNGLDDKACMVAIVPTGRLTPDFSEYPPCLTTQAEDCAPGSAAKASTVHRQEKLSRYIVLDPDVAPLPPPTSALLQITWRNSDPPQDLATSYYLWDAIPHRSAEEAHFNTWQ
jgi:hypothetical protein